MSFAQLLLEMRPKVSFEFFPPRSEKAAEKLEGVIGELLAEKPDFVSVTFGAGGSSRDGSLQLAKNLLGHYGQQVVGYLAAYGLGPQAIRDILDAYHQAGVYSILCVRGDKPGEGEDFVPHPESLPYAAELLEVVKRRHDWQLGVAGYPEGHIEAESKEKDWHFLKAKVERGAAYIISQFFYDNRFFFEFRDYCRQAGIKVPLLAGVMPIYSFKLTHSLVQRCGASLTAEVMEFFAQVNPDDKQAIEDFGVDLALRQCRELLAHGVDGLHFYTMNRSSSVRRIVRQLKSEGFLTA